MTRLTYKSQMGDYGSMCDYESDRLEITDLRNKLGHYEDLEEQGRLIKLPCKVGDTVYQVASGEKIYESKVKRFEVVFDTGSISFNEEAIENGNIFLSKADAENKLKGGAI